MPKIACNGGHHKGINEVFCGAQMAMAQVVGEL